jgi:hypothetical protein
MVNPGLNESIFGYLYLDLILDDEIVINKGQNSGNFSLSFSVIVKRDRKDTLF